LIPTRCALIEPPVVYVDTLTGAFYMNKPWRRAPFRLVWGNLERRAPGQPDSMAKIADTLKGLRK